MKQFSFCLCLLLCIYLLKAGRPTAAGTPKSRTILAARSVESRTQKGQMSKTPYRPAFACTYTTLYVDSSRSSATGDGGTWVTAYKELRDALAAASLCPNVDTILVAKGTYKPTDDTNRDSAFTILAGGIKLYGGYPSGGGTRDIAANPTLLSGDIRTLNDTTDNSYHVMVIAGLGSSADSVVVDGFTITRGNANGGTGEKSYNGSSLSKNSGGGMAMRASKGAGGKIAIQGCTFLYNHSDENGGGLFTFPASPTVKNCLFSFNSSKFGGGMYAFQSSPVLTDCMFSFNLTSQSGGGLLNNTSSFPVITNCTFSTNSAITGGGMYNVASSAPTVTNCIFNANRATYGGGMNNSSSSSPVITNCIFSTSTAAYGGGMYNVSSSAPTIINCTFSTNTATISGGGMVNEASSPVVTNCIIWANSKESINNISSSSPAVSNSDVQGTGVYPGSNNINGDPRFVNPSDPDGADNLFGTTDDGLKLQPSSPAINKGNNSAVPLTITTDITGAARIQQAIVDLGAYESPYPTPILLSIDDATKAEGNSGSTPFTFTVRLSATAPTGGVSFTIATADSTAKAPGDYTARSLAATIAQGDSTYTFDVNVNGDFLIEPAEYFLVRVTAVNGTNAYASDSVAVGTITNDDACPSSATLYVDSSMGVSGNGSSWATAFKELREALNTAAQCSQASIVLVAKGTYKPTDDNNRDSAFTILRGGLKLYGGYAPGGAGRDTGAYQTIISGDIGNPNDSTDNSYHVMVIAGLGNSADSVVVDGFTITRGNANGGAGEKPYNGSGLSKNSGGGIAIRASNGPGGKIAVRGCNFLYNHSDENGGGLFTFPASPSVVNCVFSFNSSKFGGGMYAFQSSPILSGCRFLSNTVSQSGGGMFNNVSSNPVITGCTFSANNATAHAGGMYNSTSSSPTITNCVFSTNRAGFIGGGMFNNQSCAPTITGCTFSANTAANYGGGITNQSSSSPTITNCIFSANNGTNFGGGMVNYISSSPAITNCTFSTNTARYGGGIDNDGSSPAIRGCTFSANIASTNGGGVYNESSSLPTIANCIIWANNNGIINMASTPVVSYSDVQGTGVYPGTGNFNRDPQFVNVSDPDGADNLFGTTDDGLWLQSSSPAINKGNNDSIPAGITTDITGAPRIQQAIVDMGAYESPFAPTVSITINDVSQAEGNTGTTPFTFTVRLSQPAPAGGVSFNITTLDGSATAPGDYTANFVTPATIPAGDSSYVFTVLVNGDVMVEADETFFVNLSNASGTGAVIADAQGIGTILNDDTAPDPCATDQAPPTITPKNITVYLNASGQATIRPFDVIQSLTDNCTLDSASIRISQNTFSCTDVGDSTPTAAAHLAYIASTNTGNQAFNGELGMEFRVNQTITVNQLGTFDHQSNGITGTFNGGVRVAIFNKLTRQIVPGLDATVSGLADGFAANHRLKNIAPVKLLPGNYVVVTKGYNDLELNGNAGLGSPVLPGDSAGGAINFTGSGLYGILGDASTFSFPVNPDAGPATRYLAGTFSFSTDSSTTTPVASTYQAYTTTTSTGNQAYQGELGMDFSVTTSLGITVRRLGAFDHQANGIQGAVNGGIRVAIFNRDTRQIVAGLDTVVAGLADTLSAGYRLRNIAPVYLPAGNYTIVAKGYNQMELNGNSGYGTPPAGTQDGGGAIVYSGSGLYGTQPSGFSYPTNVDAGPATRYLAGTFTYTLGSGSSMTATALSSKTTGSRLLAAIASPLGVSAAAADAGAHQAYATTITTGNQGYEAELGMEFRVNNPSGIRISRLGAFDHQANGITGTQNGGIRVAIFNKVTRTIIAGLDATVTGLADTLSAGHRLVNIAPVTLLPGDYVVVAKGYNAGELNGNSGLGTPPGAVDSAGGAVSYVGSGLYGLQAAGFNYPTNADAGPASRYLAGTFQYSVVEKAGSRTVTITASDSKGNTSTATAQVTVRDTLGACRGSIVAAAPVQQVQPAAEVETGASIRLYPNPARDRFSVQLSGMRGTGGEIEVLDINGRVVEKRAVGFSGKAGTQTQAFSLAGQPSGVYFVKVRSEGGIKTLKVIVAR